MKYLFVEYPPCSTCRNAKKFLNENGIVYTDRHIVEETPSVDELKKWIALGNLEINKLFNTSGNVYKELKLKDSIKIMSDEDKLSLLASNGMLIKRPILIGEEVYIGFKLEQYQKLIK